MTRYEQGFFTKCASVGIPEHVATALLKRAYELGSVSPETYRDSFRRGGTATRPDYYSFDPKDPETAGGSYLFADGKYSGWANAYGSLPPLEFRDAKGVGTSPVRVFQGINAETIPTVQESKDRLLNYFNRNRPHISKDNGSWGRAPRYYSLEDVPDSDYFHAVSRIPLYEGGQPNSTTWKDNMDYANLQSDAIRRRRGAGKPLLFDEKMKRWRPESHFTEQQMAEKRRNPK